MRDTSEGAEDTEHSRLHHRGHGVAPKPFLELLMRNPIRRRILHLLKTNPGLNKRQLSKKLGIFETAVDFHLERLAKGGLVKTRSLDNHRETFCFRAENVHLWENPSTRILFGRSPPRQVALHLARHPGTEAKQVAAALSMNLHTVRRHLRTLENHNLAKRFRAERQVIYHAEPELINWVVKVGNAPALLDI